MSEQLDKDTTLNKTLYILVRQLGLTPEEVVLLRLSDLHLAGKSPNISFTPAGQKEPKTVELDLTVHRALVGWLVSRPDSVSDFLFPGDSSEPMKPVDVQQAIAGIEEEETTQAKDQGMAAKTTRPEDEGIDPGKPKRAPGPVPPFSEDEPPVMTGTRPVPPLTRPEMGTPPRRPGDQAPPPSRPTTSPPPPPETNEAVNIPLPSAMPQPPPIHPPEAERPPARPVRRAAREPKRVPTAAEPRPKPVKPEEPKTEDPVEVAKSGPAEQARPFQPAADKPPLERATPFYGPPGAETTMAGRPSGARVRGAGTPGQPVAKTSAAGDPRVTPDKDSSLPTAHEKGVRSASRPVAPQRGRPTAEEIAQQSRQEEGRSRLIRYVVPATITVVLLLCAGCVGGGWFAWQGVVDSGLLAGLGLSNDALESEPGVGEAGETVPEGVVFETPNSALATPTLPPTITATPVPPTDTPALPTETPTVIATDTPTLVPTDTPVPTNTPSPEAPAETPTPEEPADTPTPSMKYGAPVLLEPKDGFEFIAGNTIELRWQPVGELAPNEQYAVRLRYLYNNEITYQGTNLQETEWTVPLSLFGQVDPPENRYEWWVVVERLNEDGSGTAISPESEIRTFTWK